MKRPDLSQQSGVIAIFLVIVLSLLLLGTTVSASRLNVSALSQSTQVNQSDLAYYAAEAGVQDASRRIDNNPGFTDLYQLFPEEYCGPSSSSALVGDWTDIENSDGTPAWTASSGPRIYTESTNGCNVNQGPSPDPGAVSWHNRRVYNAGLNPSGSLEKDQTIQIDTTLLCDPAGAGCGNTPSVQNSNHNQFNEMDFCFTPNSSGVAGVNNIDEQIELTTASYTGASLGSTVPVSVYKHIFPVAGGPGFPAAYTDPNGVTYSEVIPLAGVGYGTCITASISDHSQRFIFRPRLLLNQFQSGTSITTNQSAITANYKVFLLGDSCNNDLASSNCMYVQNDIFFIDVVGQSGSIRRRIVAEKLHNGQLLGIFDFLLYSGDKVIPLCKAGVNTSYNSYSQQCLATTP